MTRNFTAVYLDLLPFRNFTVTRDLLPSTGTGKKQGASAKADSAKDTVQVDDTVWAPQDFMNGREFKGIEFGIDCKSVLALAKALN